MMQKIVSLVTALAALCVAIVMMAVSVRTALVYATWIKTDGAVQAIEPSLVGEGSRQYGAVRVKFSYPLATMEGSAWAVRFNPWDSQRFAREYSVGSRHTIWVNPSNAEEAEVAWSRET